MIKSRRVTHPEAGLFADDAKAHLLKPILSDDVRALTGRPSFVKDAPVNLVCVADLSRMPRAAPGDRDVDAAAHTGFISQNVSLFCASEGMATVVRASIDRAVLASAMRLRPDQKIILAQTVGYPVATKLMQQTIANNGVATIQELRELSQEAGVKFVVCQMTVELFGFDHSDFVDGMDYVGAASFLPVAQKSDVCLFI